MARVRILTHDRFTDRRTGIAFEPKLTALPSGGTGYLGHAEVPDDVAREFYLTHPSFHVEWLAPDAPPAPGEGGSTPDTPPASDPASTPSPEGEPSTSPTGEPAPDASAPSGRGRSRNKKPPETTAE